MEQCGTVRNKSEETKNTAHHQGLQGCSGIVNFVGFFLRWIFIADVRPPQTNKCGVLREIMMKSKVLSAVGTQGVEKWQLQLQWPISLCTVLANADLVVVEQKCWMLQVKEN